MFLTQAAVDLEKAIEDRGWTHAQVEEALGLHTGSGLISKLLQGERRASMEVAGKLEQLFGIPIARWLVASSVTIASARMKRRRASRTEAA